MRLRHSIFGSLVLVALTAGAVAADTGFSAIISAASEVPTNASPGTGTGTMILNNAGTSLSFSISYSGLLANSSAAHFHGPAAPGVNAGVVFNLAPFGTLGSTSGSFAGAWTIDATNLARLNSGLLYINIHTSSFPGGEIRGQVVSNPTANLTSTWGRIKKLYR